MITIAGDEDSLAAKLREREARSNIPYMKYLSKQPTNLVGTTHQVAARISEYMALGVDHFILRFHFGEEIEGMRLFTEKVRPSLNANSGRAK